MNIQIRNDYLDERWTCQRRERGCSFWNTKFHGEPAISGYTHATSATFKLFFLPLARHLQQCSFSILNLISLVVFRSFPIVSKILGAIVPTELTQLRRIYLSADVRVYQIISLCQLYIIWRESFKQANLYNSTFLIINLYIEEFINIDWLSLSFFHLYFQSRIGIFFWKIFHKHWNCLRWQRRFDKCWQIFSDLSKTYHSDGSSLFIVFSMDYKLHEIFKCFI